MRTAMHRPAAPFVLLLIAVFVHTAFGPVLACHTITPEQPVASVAAVTALVQETGGCPGCLPDAPLDAEGNASVPANGDPSGSPAVTGLCTPDRPCHHAPAGRDTAVDPAVRGVDAPRDSGPALLSTCFRPDQVEQPVLPAPASNPVPPAAVLAPVAVLCVDRN